MFSKACEYGIRAVVIVAQHSMDKKRISLKEIAKAINSPEAFTSKILQKLVKDGYVNSIQGAYGGFEIKQQVLESLTLENIVHSIDGEDSYKQCVLGLQECSEKNPCPAHKQYKYIKANFIHMLQIITIKEMVHDTQKGVAFLKIGK